MKKKLNKKRRKIDFIKQRKILHMFSWVFFGFVLVLAQILAFTLVSGKPFDFANATEVVIFSQSITPLELVRETIPIQPIKKNIGNSDMHSTKFRIVTPIGVKKEDTAALQEQPKIKTTPVVTFNGTSLYPNSQVFLDVHSTRFFSSTFTDNQGRWSWTNYGHPLESGDHTIEAYNIVPFELANKRDIFAQKYFFTVTDDKSVKNNVVSLGNSDYPEAGGNDDLDDRIRGDRLDNTYIFSAVLPERSRYSFGDKINLELLFSPLGKGLQNEADISYTIYTDNGDNVANQNESVSTFSDHVSLNEGGYFIKNISLHENIMPGNYVMKIIAKIGSDTYYQSVMFNISATPLMTIGSNVITVQKFVQMMVFNVILIVAILMVVISLIIIEFKRYIAYKPIDESLLARKGYFTK